MHLRKNEQKREGFVIVACPTIMAGVGHLKRICKDAFSVQETSSSEVLGGPGGDFLRGLHFGAYLQVC